MEENVKRSLTGIKACIGVLMLLVLGIIAACFIHLRDYNALTEKVNACMEITVVTDSVTFIEPTVDEILTYRNTINHDRYLDSVYLSMPEVSLRAILEEHGTGIGSWDIADIYLSDIDKYKAIEKGAKIQKSIIKEPN